MTRLSFVGLVAFMALEAEVSQAHTVGVSRGEYRVSGTNVHAELVFARSELIGAGSISAGDADDVTQTLAHQIARKLQLSTPAGPCAGAFESARVLEQDGLAIRASYRCGTAAKTLSIQLGFLSSLSLGHRHLATMTGPDGMIARAVAYEARPELTFSGLPATTMGSVVWPLFRLGLEHILTGYDHLVFLFGLILVGGRLRKLLVVVTAFTLAHSVTLALAALGVWAPSPRLVEPAIAFSIAYVGIENWFIRDASRRWLITFPFGLVHGFGFSSALAEIALPSGQIPLALASFNAGVEVGQVMVLIVALPAVLWLARRRWFTEVGVKAASTGVALAGFLWLAERLAWAIPH